MILLTVGTQLPFERLAKRFDEWCRHEEEVSVVAQLGESTYSASHFKSVEALGPSAFSEVLQSTSHMVAHAGIGSILTARRSGIPILIVPRLEELMEVRSDHQVATANVLRGRPGIVVCDDMANFDECMDQLLAMERGPATMNTADPSLVTALQRFVDFGEFPD